MNQSQLPASADPAQAFVPCTAPRYPVATTEYAIASAWAPANAIEEHLVRKIGALGITIENILNNLTALDPAVPVQAGLISTLSLTVSRLQKTQSGLESELRGIQSQRGIRATHPLTCEPLPPQADARPYVREGGIRPTVYKPAEPIFAPEGFPEEALTVLEAHYGTRIRYASELRDGRPVFSPKVIERLAARLQTPLPVAKSA